MIEIGKPKFSIGTLVATPGALAALTEAGKSPIANYFEYLVQ